ncbi:MAG: NIPSNAP family protein [Bryobacteraceae bacterium]|nr:NIPSNAP family protein [Bryobacteraceae bacterium]
MSFYTIHQYVLAQGGGLERLHEYLSAVWLPAAGRRPVLILEGVVTSPLPQVLVVTGHDSPAHYASLHAPEPADLLYESLAVRHLRPTNYSPLLAPSSGAPRYFEYRLYQAPNAAKMIPLHERFAGPEIAIFHRCGIRPVLYAETVAGEKMPNLVYLTPFASLAERETAWNTFRADPEWIDVRTAHAAAHGPVPKSIEISLYKAATYSPVK